MYSFYGPTIFMAPILKVLLTQFYNFSKDMNDLNAFTFFITSN